MSEDLSLVEVSALLNRSYRQLLRDIYSGALLAKKRGNKWFCQGKDIEKYQETIRFGWGHGTAGLLAALVAKYDDSVSRQVLCVAFEFAMTDAVFRESVKPTVGIFRSDLPLDMKGRAARNIIEAIPTKTAERLASDVANLCATAGKGNNV